MTDDTRQSDVTSGAATGNAAPPRRANLGFTAAVLAVFAAGMVGMSFAAVPLYSIFCQVTGYGGTTRQAQAAPDKILDRVVTVQAHHDGLQCPLRAPVDGHDLARAGRREVNLGVHLAREQRGAERDTVALLDLHLRPQAHVVDAHHGHRAGRARIFDYLLGSARQGNVEPAPH